MKINGVKVSVHIVSTIGKCVSLTTLNTDDDSILKIKSKLEDLGINNYSSFKKWIHRDNIYQLSVTFVISYRQYRRLRRNCKRWCNDRDR